MANTPLGSGQNLTPEELELLKKATKELETQAKIRLDISGDMKKYLEVINDLKHSQKVITDLEKQQAKLRKSMVGLDEQATKEAELKLKILEDQTNEIKNQAKVIQGAVAGIDSRKIGRQELLTKGAGAIAKAVVNLDQSLINGYNKLKGLGLFEMDKAIKQSALEMGVLSKESQGYRATIKDVAKRTSAIGIGVKELAEMQSAYTDELGRNVMMSEKGMESMAQIAASTSLGAQGTAKMAADMENVGLSTERVGQFVNQSLNKTHKMGLNASKTLKNLTGGMKLLNRYNFKEGLKGLDKMARTVTKLGVSMEFAAGMADKLWNIEGAVDMSAQLQVMGGAFAQMADPFHLMYMARNDMNGLVEELGNAAAASAKFNKKTGEFDLSAMEMHRLKIVAEDAGIAYEDLATAGKNAAKFTKIKSQIHFSIGGGEEGKDIKEFLTNKAFLDEKGKATIMLNGQPKLLSQLKSTDRETIKALVKEEENMEKRAKNARTFDEALENLINGMKVSLLPIVEVMNRDLLPKLDALAKRFVAEGWDKKLEYFATKLGELISFFGGWVIDNPIKTAVVYGATKIGGFLFEKASWFANGLALASGFKSGTGGGVGGTIKENLGRVPGAKGSALKGAGIGAGLGIAGGLVDANTESTNVWGKAGAGALEGAAAGAMFGPWGMAVGAALGGIIRGGMAYAEKEDLMTDGLFNAPVRDAKFGKLPAIPKPKNLSSNFSKNRGIMQGGKITPIDNKDDLLAMKKGGAIDKFAKNDTEGQNMKVDFGEITINGKIEIYSPGAPGLSIDLLKDPNFKRDITRVVSSEIEKNRNGGKNKG